MPDVRPWQYAFQGNPMGGLSCMMCAGRVNGLNHIIGWLMLDITMLKATVIVVCLVL